MKLTLFSIVLRLGLAITLIVGLETVSAEEPPLKKITIMVADEPLEIYEGSQVFPAPVRFRNEKDFRERFVNLITEYLTGEHASKGYDAQISRMAGEGLFEASILARILPQPYLKRLSKIKAAKIALFVDPNGRIYFKEILVYDPKTPIYCAGQGRPSVPLKSSIPCLTKKKVSAQSKIDKLSKEAKIAKAQWANGQVPKDAAEILTDWREALLQLASARPVKKVAGLHPGLLLEMSDQELWGVIWSQSQQTLIQSHSFLPQYGGKVSGNDCLDAYSGEVCKIATDTNRPPQEVHEELEQIKEEQRLAELRAGEIRQWCSADVCHNCGTSIEPNCRQSFEDKCAEFEFSEEACTVAAVIQEQRRRDQIAAEAARRRNPNSESVPLITGFTFAEDEDWEKIKRTCVDYNPLWPGCTRYHLKAYYRYSYALGLRIPVRLNASSRNVREDPEGIHTGILQVSLVPFNGDANDYRDAGMPEEYVFGGREALAEFCMPDGCGAGFEANIPGPNFSDFYGVDGVNLLKKAFSSGRIRRGEINPPDVGEDELLGLKQIDFDLLFGNLNFWAFGAEVLPVFRLDMGGLAKSIHANLEETSCNSDRQMTFRPGNASHHFKEFVIQDNRRTAYLFKPSYTFDLKLKVGAEPLLFVDFGVWSHTWNIARIWFPWGISSPEISLDHHQGTNCGLRFAVTRQTN